MYSSSELAPDDFCEEFLARLTRTLSSDDVANQMRERGAVRWQGRHDALLISESAIGRVLSLACTPTTWTASEDMTRIAQLLSGLRNGDWDRALCGTNYEDPGEGAGVTFRVKVSRKGVRLGPSDAVEREVTAVIQQATSWLPTWARRVSVEAMTDVW
eukprot:CAMPEP_0119324476 /NCGR_PEP_ID=MMETSP1333-20130426/63336_1 /TAXON_ID=418940 /ORGANISM="Scyphosphaera apsteinii, Strain RCC1455" /LENGTH=157 /DNA_ID=CAMNT_0007332179 /DNA_START=30 /DNA_END=500 /DNA_ORIENTATION=+